MQRIWLASGEIEVTGVGYDPAGHFEVQGKRIDYHRHADLLGLLETGLRCNHARVVKDETGWHEIGEPTEAALVVAAYKAWLHPDDHPHTLNEFSFNSRRKRMTVIEHRPEGGHDWPAGLCRLCAGLAAGPAHRAPGMGGLGPDAGRGGAAVPGADLPPERPVNPVYFPSAPALWCTHRGNRGIAPSVGFGPR